MLDEGRNNGASCRGRVGPDSEKQNYGGSTDTLVAPSRIPLNAPMATFGPAPTCCGYLTPAENDEAKGYDGSAIKRRDEDGSKKARRVLPTGNEAGRTCEQDKPLNRQVAVNPGKHNEGRRCFQDQHQNDRLAGPSKRLRGGS